MRIGRRPHACRVRAKSVNRNGLESVRLSLANRFGIHSRIYSHGRVRNPKWSHPDDLEMIRPESILNYAQEIGFTHPLKKERLNFVSLIWAYRCSP